jgi:hypothetical protein
MNRGARLRHPTGVIGSRIATVLLAGLFVACVSACSAASSSPAAGDKFLAPPDGVSGVSSNTSVERYFPMVDGTIYNYRTTAEDGDPGLLIIRVRRADATHGELLYKNGRKKRFAYSPEGVRIEGTGNFVLVAPIQAGVTFRGQNGCPAHIEDVGVVMDVKAGSYTDCVRTVELCSGDTKVRYSTTLCLDIGVVVMDAEAGTAYDHAELVSAGPPVDITDGTTVIPGPEGGPIPGPPPPSPMPAPPP